ncbi:MAG: CRISPR-associated endonuclease Cas2, partial [bacterium]|nr:CRISPR-associated endonuclease Cas2 [bacterium]
MKRLEKGRYTPPLGYSMPKAILDILIDLGENLLDFKSPYQHIRRIRSDQRRKDRPPWWRYNQAMKYLEHRSYIKVKTEGDRIFIKLTKKGKLNALLDRIDKLEKTHRKSDGKWRIIVWDIPESSSKQRDQLRRFVKKLGFYKLQFSVFIRPYPIAPEAVTYLKESGLIRFIRFLRVDKIDDDKFLKKHFKM